MSVTTLVTIFGVGAVLMAVAVVFMYGMDGSGTPRTPAEHGRRLFRLQGCASCHAIGGGMSRGPDLAGLIPRLSARLTDGAYRDHLDSLRVERPNVYEFFASRSRYEGIFNAQGDDRIKTWFARHLHNPRFDHFTGLMPDYDHLSDEQVEQLTAFILTLK